jgi:enamine deaminase RidA (YjgF/YER057c/UK114 family)
MIKRLLLVPAALAISLPAGAQTAKASPQPNADLPVPTAGTPLPTGTSAARWAGNALYVSGSLDPDLESHKDTQSQTVGLITDLQRLLASQKLTLGDVVMMHVYLGADPAKGGKMDFAGMMAGYTQFFGTKDQPNKPARTTVQVVLPAGARGALIEIDLVAVRSDEQAANPHPSLAGTWTLVAADRQLPNGARVRDYGEHPEGRMMIDGRGRYSIQIFRSERPNFAANDKARGTPEEMREAVLGSSTNYGELTVDWTTHTLRMTIDESSYPNFRNQVQTRPFEFDGEILSYRVPPRPDGSVPISVWRRER